MKAQELELCLRCGARTTRSEVCCEASPAGAPARIAWRDGLLDLQIAHFDCDAFFAAVEKRDNPRLHDKPVIVGGGRRGVVSTACYIARTYGVRSAMPMFKALKACPHAVVVKPSYEKYAAAARQVRDLAEALTPQIEPLSIDEAFLDLSGTSRLHGAPPALMLAKLQEQVKEQIGVTVSIGLSWNKFLAKLASDLEKPEGFTAITRAETVAFLAPLPVAKIWGVGKTMERRLKADGVATFGDLQRMDPREIVRRYDSLGERLARLAFGDDDRPVRTTREAKSVSSETTFDKDIVDLATLDAVLTQLAEKVARRTKDKGLVGRVAQLKLKSTDFKVVTRRTTLERPSNLARTLEDAARTMLRRTADGRRAYRLIGVGYCELAPVDAAARQTDLFGDDDAEIARREAAIDAVRAKFGDDAIATARVLRHHMRAGADRRAGDHPPGDHPKRSVR